MDTVRQLQMSLSQAGIVYSGLFSELLPGYVLASYLSRKDFSFSRLASALQALSLFIWVEYRWRSKYGLPRGLLGRLIVEGDSALAVLFAQPTRLGLRLPSLYSTSILESVGPLHASSLTVLRSLV